jgi:enolase
MSDAVLTRIDAREILDSRGRPTVEAEVVTSAGARGRAAVPSGASTGTHEAVELRDGDERRGVRKAVANVRGVIAPALLGRAVTDQAGLDHALVELDGTPNKSRLGANALLGVSLATAHAAAASRNQPLWRYLDRGQAALPLPMVNMISGGLHAGGNLDFQDFLLMPAGARSYSEALEMTTAVYRALGHVLRSAGHEAALVGDEGGYGPKLPSCEAAVVCLLDAIRKAGLRPGRDAGVALDVAASHFFDGSRYKLSEGDLDAGGLVDLLAGWAATYPILSIEDGLAEDDWDGWRELTRRLGDKVQLVGDDLFVTNPERLSRGIRQGVANAVLVKVNQVGTLTEAFQVMEQARAAGYRCVVSARSGETEDGWLADLAVATGAGQIKVGGVARSERLAKYNQLLRIEEELTRFAAWPA